MSAHARLPISSLPLWQALNDVSFVDARLADIPSKGFGLVASRSLGTNEATADRPTLVTVPHGLILNAEAVEQYAKQDRNFRQLLDVAGAQSERGNVLLFLLVQVVIGLKPSPDTVALPTAWTEYVKFLPDNIPLPTLWTDTERLLLRGTSLESAVEAKRIALEIEFDRLRETSSDLPFWQAAFWDPCEADAGTGLGTGPRLEHWFLLDAWYRSRCLELPRSGPAMVPCIDMVNHSATPNAYYEENGMRGSDEDGEVVLLLRPQQSVAVADEITISYSGADADSRKPASEMLFSYGFVDPLAVRQSLVLPFRPFPDDPLAKAKLHVFGTSPRLEMERLGSIEEDEEDDNTNDATTRWSCPFAFLMCVNEEDGISFQLRQETDGTQQLRMFWQDEDVTDRAGDFEALTGAHPKLAAIVRLRVMTVLQEVLEAQLERMQSTAAEAQQAQDGGSLACRPDVARQAGLLRDMESRVISSVLEALELERSNLLTDASVVAYLGSMEVAENEIAGGQAHDEQAEDEQTEDSSDEDDFS